MEKLIPIDVLRAEAMELYTARVSECTTPDGRVHQEEELEAFRDALIAIEHRADAWWQKHRDRNAERDQKKTESLLVALDYLWEKQESDLPEENQVRQAMAAYHQTCRQLILEQLESESQMVREATTIAISEWLHEAAGYWREQIAIQFSSKEEGEVQ